MKGKQPRIYNCRFRTGYADKYGVTCKKPGRESYVCPFAFGETQRRIEACVYAEPQVGGAGK